MSMHRSHPPLPRAAIPPQDDIATATRAWFTGISFAPVPLIVLLYGIDGLILPSLYFGGGHLPFALGTAALAGLFLAGAAHDRREPRRSLLATAVLANFLCAAAALCLMFVPMRDIDAALEALWPVAEVEDCGCE